MQNLRNKIPQNLLKEEQLRGAYLSVYFRWGFILLLLVLLLIQYSLGHHLVTRHALIFLGVYFMSNVFFSFALYKRYDPRYLRFLSATVDIAVISYHLYGMVMLSDYAAVTAAASIFFIPVFFVIYTFRVDRGLLIYLIFISLLGYNLAYFASYYQNPGFYNEFLSLSPVSQIFKSIYILVIGLLCIYLQNSVFRFLYKQLLQTEEKARLDTEVKIEQEKNLYAQKLIDRERRLNKELADEFLKKDELTTQLKESKEQIKSIIANLHGFSYRCKPDDNWTMLFVSEQVEDVCGYKPEKFTEQSDLSYASLIHTDDIEFVRNQINNAIITKKQFDFEYRIIHKNGNVVWVHEAGRGVYDKDGNITYIDGIITDVSNKKQAEEELEETQELVNNIISNLVGAVSRCLHDEKFTTKFYSDKIFDITGYYATDFIDNRNISFSDIIHPNDIERVRLFINDCVNEHKSYSFEFRIIHKNGNIVWVNESGQPVYDREGNVVYLDGITTDITAKKQAEVALKTAEEKFRRIVETSPVAISFGDKDGSIEFVNEMFTKLFGYTADDIPDFEAYFKKIYPDKDYRENIVSVWQEAIENAKRNNGYIEPYEVIMTCKDGTKKHVIAYTALLEDSYLAIFNDISELKEAEASLSKAKEELETLNLSLEKEVEERTAQLTAANTQLLKLQKENLQSQFEVLKQQVNPHFLFNSLNVLTSLIKVDTDLAEKFTERLSKVYRHVLENKEKDIIALSTEMEFLRAYVFLVDIRFANKVFVDIGFNEKDIDAYVVPLALQLLIENAVKHNTFSKKSPLKIKLFIDKNNYLNIINNLQNRGTQMSSTGVGLVNIIKRYSLLTEKEPIFEMTDNEFIAKIPLIKNANSKYE